MKRVLSAHDAQVGKATWLIQLGIEGKVVEVFLARSATLRSLGQAVLSNRYQTIMKYRLKTLSRSLMMIYKSMNHNDHPSAIARPDLRIL
jgi:hypothetical protein